MKDSIRIELLEGKIFQLEKALDSFNRLVTERRLEFDLNKQHDIISKVNEFYDSAWLKLIFVISILGVFVPLFAQYYQRQNTKDLMDYIGGEIKDRFDTRLNELKDYNKQQIEIALEDHKVKLASMEKFSENILRELDASTFYLQGRSNLLSKRYDLAMVNFFRSADLWLTSNRPNRANVIFQNMIICLKQINDNSILISINDALKKDNAMHDSIEKKLDKYRQRDDGAKFVKKLDQILEEIQRIELG
jgi:hypothetical protein